MAQVLPPLFLETNAPGTPIEGPIGPQGPVGPPGSTGPAGPSGGGGSNLFIYRDTEPSPTGNMFATWAGAYAAAIAVNSPATIMIDDSLNTCSIPLGAGNFDLHQITLIGNGKQFNVVFVVNEGVTWNEGVYRITGGLLVFTEYTSNSYLITSTKDVEIIIDEFSLMGPDGQGGIIDLSSGTSNLSLKLYSGSAAIGSFVNFGNSGSNCEIVMGEGSVITSDFHSGTSGNVNIDVFSLSVSIPASFTVLDNIIDVDINWTSNSDQLAPFSGNSLPTLPDFSKNIERGTMFFHDSGNGQPLWWNGSNWVDAGTGYQPQYFQFTLSTPQVANLATGEHIPFDVFQASWVPNGQVQLISPIGGSIYANAGRTFLSFQVGTNVGYKLVGNLGSLFDGSIAIQWWDMTNNIGLGNITGNIGGGFSGDAVAILQPSYSTVTIEVELRLVFVSGTTFIGENSAAGFVFPWATIETIGVAQ